jgi:hypothetical protein
MRVKVPQILGGITVFSIKDLKERILKGLKRWYKGYAGDSVGLYLDNEWTSRSMGRGKGKRSY